MTRLARPLPGDRLLGRYQLVELAAEGPHSAVYRGVEIESERTVALKFDLEGRDIEARALRRLNSPRVIALVDAGSIDAGASGLGAARPETNHAVIHGASFCVLPWLAGQSLAQHLDTAELTLEHSLRLGIAAAEALSDVHAAGVIHCDLKPSNLWLPTADLCAPLLIDLGSARLDDGREDQPRLGTPGFASPEQLRGGLITPAADLFGLGALLYRCLAGYAAFPGGTPALVALASLSPALAPPSRLPPALQALLASLLAQAASARPPSAEQVAASLRHTLSAATGAELAAQPEQRGGARAAYALEGRGLAAADHRGPTDEVAAAADAADWLRLRLRRRRELTARCLQLAGGRRELLEALLSCLPGAGADFDLSAESALWSQPGLVALTHDLRRLAPAAREVLRAVSALGELRRQTLRAVLSFTAEKLELAIAGLVAGGWLVEERGEGGGGRAYGLTATLVGHLLLREITPAERRALHRAAAAQLLSDQRLPGAPALLARIGEHFGAAEQPELAISMLELAARRAMQQAQVAAARRFGERALALASSSSALYVLLAEACNSLGEPALAIRHAEQALRDVQPESPEWWAAKRELATAWRRRGADARLRQLAHELLAVAGPAADVQAISCLTRVAEELAYTAHARLAPVLIARLPAPSAAQRPAWRALLADAESTRAYVAGDLVGCQRAMQRAAALYRELGDVQRAVIREVHLGWSQLELGQLAGAERSLRQARLSAQQISCWPALASAEQNLGYCLALRGDLQGGMAMLASAVQSGRVQQHRRLLVGGYELLARVQLLAGDWASALDSAERGLAELETGAEPQRAPLFALLAQARLAAGETDAARAALELAWCSYQGGVGLEGTEQLWVLLARVAVLSAAGQTVQPRRRSRQRGRWCWVGWPS